MKNWKFNLKNILLAVLTAVVGWLGTSEAYTYVTAEEPTKYAETATVPDGNTWTVVTYLDIERQSPGLPGYKDYIGRETIFVQSGKKPTDKQVIAAFDPELNPDNVRLVRPKYIKPPGYQEPVPDDEPDIE